MTSQRRVRKFHELLKPVSHSAKCTCSASCLSLCVTRKRCLHLHAPLPPSRRCVLRVATTLCFTFLYLLSLVLSFLVYFRVLTICHKGDTLCSFGQGTTSGLPCTRKGSVGEAPRCFFWVRFICQLVFHRLAPWL